MEESPYVFNFHFISIDLKSASDNNFVRSMATTGLNGEILSMILVMGVTGSGKSYFINRLANGNVVDVGDDLHSCKHRLAPW